MSYEDLREHGSESAVKAAGKLRQQGKPYESETSIIPSSTPRLTTFSLQWWMEISLIGSLERDVHCVLRHVASISMFDIDLRVENAGMRNMKYEKAPFS